MNRPEEETYTNEYVEQYIIALNDRQVLSPDSSNYHRLNDHRQTLISVLGSLRPKATLQLKETNLWKWYLNDRKVNLVNIKRTEEILVRAHAMVEIIMREVMSTGYWTSLFHEAREARSSFFSFCEKESLDVSLYELMVDNYERDYRSALLSSRLREEFEGVNIKQVSEKFESYENEVARVDSSLQKKSDEIVSRIIKNEKILKGIEKRTGLTALHSSYHSFADGSRKKRHYVSVERIVLTVAVVILVVAAIAISWISEGNYLLMLPIAALFLFVTYLIRVNIKRGDDLDQTILKIEHVLAVNEFYNNVKDEIVKPEDARLFNESYFKFVFSKIEPASSSQPDMYDGILNIAKEFSRKNDQMR